MTIDSVFPIVTVSKGGPAGPRGWSPETAIVEDDDRRVIEVVDWVGGTGIKPEVLGYIGATGLVADIGDAIDVRGTQGLQGDQGIQGDQGDTGEKGWSPRLAVVTDGTRRVLQVADWVGGGGDKPSAGQYVGELGLVSDPVDAIDVRGDPGEDGEVQGPANSTDSAVALWDGTAGNALKDGPSIGTGANALLQRDANGDFQSSNVTYDNSTSGLAADNVKAAIDEIVASKGWQLHETLTVSTPVDEVVIDDIPSGYSALAIVLDAIQHDNESNAVVGAEMSIDNGSSFISAVSLSVSDFFADPSYGHAVCRLTNYDGSRGSAVFAELVGGSTATITAPVSMNPAADQEGGIVGGAVDALRFYVGINQITGGTISVYLIP